MSKKLSPSSLSSPPDTRFEKFRITHNILPSQLYRTSPLSSRTIDRMRDGRNVVISSARSIAHTIGLLIDRRVEVEELFDLTPHSSFVDGGGTAARASPATPAKFKTSGKPNRSASKSTVMRTAPYIPSKRKSSKSSRNK